MIRPTGKSGRRGAVWALALGALLAVALGGAPAAANHRVPLAGGVDVNCSGPSAELRAEVRNPNARDVVLTHALLYVYTYEAGRPTWNQPTITNLLLEEEATPTTPARYDFVLSPGEQKGSAQMMSLVPGVDRVFAILWVRVQGERFWRYAYDVDSCQ